jgi:hypothetical protein
VRSPTTKGAELAKFYSKLERLPPSERDLWEDYLLHWYKLQEAGRLVDILLDDGTWPRILDAVDERCRTLKVVLLTEAAAAAHALGHQVDAPFIQGLVEVRGGPRGLISHYHHDLQGVAVSRVADHQPWIVTTHEVLQRSFLLRRSDLIEYLGLQQLLRHFRVLGVFEEILDSGGMIILDSKHISESEAAYVVDPTEVDVRQYYGPWGMDLYGITYQNPAVDLSRDYDHFYFDNEYVTRLYQTVAASIRSTGARRLRYEDLGRVVSQAWELDVGAGDRPLEARLVRGRCRPDFLQKLMRDLFRFSFWADGVSAVDGPDLLTAAGIERTPDGLVLRD